MECIQPKYEHKVWIPDIIIQDAINHKWESSLAYLVLLRSKYKNPIFYNFTYRSMSEKTGISSAVLCRHVKVLMSKGMISIHCGNLMINGTNRIKGDDRLTAVKVGKNKQDTILNIQFTRTLKNFQKQKRITALKIEIKKLQRAKYTDSKKAKKLLDLRKRLFNKKTEKSVNDYLMLSNFKFGSLCNRSKSTGYLIQKRMNDSGLISSSKNTLICSGERYDAKSFYSMYLPGNYALSSLGYVFKNMPNKIKVVSASNATVGIK